MRWLAGRLTTMSLNSFNLCEGDSCIDLYTPEEVVFYPGETVDKLFSVCRKSNASGRSAEGAMSRILQEVYLMTCLEGGTMT